MKCKNILLRLILITLVFSFIQIPQTYATTDTAYVAGRFAWDLAEMLKNKQTEINVPAEVINNKLLGNCLKAATDVYPEGDAQIKSIKFSGITKVLSVEYIAPNSRVFIANSKQDIIQIRSIAHRLNLDYFLVALPKTLSINSFEELTSNDYEIEYSPDGIVMNLFDKSNSSIANYVWKFPYVYSFEVVKGTTAEDRDIINSFVQKYTKNVDLNLSVKDKVKYVNSILVSNFEYEISNTEDVNIHLPAYMIKNGKGVCSAYALLSYKMLKALNVPTILISGKTITDENVGHVWLKVKAENNQWYHFDPTWNDPVPDVKGRVKTDYLFLTDTEISQDHIFDMNEYNSVNCDKKYDSIKSIDNPQFILTINNNLINFNNIQLSTDINPNVTPIIVDNRTYLPLRILIETLGGSIGFDDMTKTISIILNNKEIQLQLNSTIATVNGQQKTLLAQPIVTDGRTLLPVRSIMELLDKNVQWNDATKQVIIN